MERNSMRKADIANEICEQIGIPGKESMEILEKFLALIKETLQKGETVKLAGFGNFFVRQKNARMGRNPKTGEPVEIAPRRVVRFKPSQEFRRLGATKE